MDWPFDPEQSVYISTPGRYARASASVKRITKSKGCNGRATVELLLDRDLSQDGPLTANLMKGAGGGNFDVTLWLGNVWMYSSDVGKHLRTMLETSGERPVYKIVRDNLGSDPSHGTFLRDLFKSENLNQCQRKAIQCVLKAQQFSLIQGFPGSGKTSLIVSIIRILLQLDRRVLITAHTHSAVDNMLVRVLPHLTPQMVQKTVRIGVEHKMHGMFIFFYIPFMSNYASVEVRHVAEKRYIPKCTEGPELMAYYNKARLIAGTCMGVARHSMLIQGKADYVIVDEASQVSEPIVLGALFHAGTLSHYSS